MLFVVSVALIVKDYLKKKNWLRYKKIIGFTTNI